MSTHRAAHITRRAIDAGMFGTEYIGADGEKLRGYKLAEPDKRLSRRLWNRARLAWLFYRSRVAEGGDLRPPFWPEIARPEICDDCCCGGKIDGHHDDYMYPFHVRWLCKSCHYEADHGARFRKQRGRLLGYYLRDKPTATDPQYDQYIDDLITRMLVGSQDRERVVLFLRSRGLSYERISQDLGIGNIYARKIFDRAKHRIREWAAKSLGIRVEGRRRNGSGTCSDGYPEKRTERYL